MDEELSLLLEWICRAYIVRALCNNTDVLDERIKQQEERLYREGFSKGLILGA